MNGLFGTDGIMAMRNENAHMHPLAQLSAAGKGIVNGAVRNIAASTGLSIASGPLKAMEFSAVGTVADFAAQLFSGTAFLGLTAGVVLFYVLPLMPFVFFFFAVGTWIKTLFEAMVGVPLWAMAHMRLDGEGLPGEAASNGYFLILDIFLRPIMTVIGLIAAMTIFAVQVRVLNFTWDLVIDNVGGLERDPNAGFAFAELGRGIVDQFFFTIIYIIIVYMMANASFKLIDMIPDNILRWAGASVGALGDQDKNTGEELTRYAGTGGLLQGRKVVMAVNTSASGLGEALRQGMTSQKTPPGAN
jgi:conjugal transfer/type IV secretion protein DotA/TraY